jgi:hypothetical protein
MASIASVTVDVPDPTGGFAWEAATPYRGTTP